MPDWARRRFEMRPGITGLAQVNGSIALPWEERWKHDVHYIDACTFTMDVGIVLKTLWVILRGEDRFRRIR
jgi:lipopolysaccharide/colanic/teichoic acid biosynthesis glycosyltransferase